MVDETTLTEPAVPNKRRQLMAVMPIVFRNRFPTNALTINLQLLPTEKPASSEVLAHFEFGSKPWYGIGNRNGNRRSHGRTTAKKSEKESAKASQSLSGRSDCRQRLETADTNGI